MAKGTHVDRATVMAIKTYKSVDVDTRKKNDTIYPPVSSRLELQLQLRALLFSGDTDNLLRDQIRLVLYHHVICTQRKSNYREINVGIA